MKKIVSSCFLLLSVSVFSQVNTDSLRYYMKHKDLNTRVDKVTRLAWSLNPPTPDTSLFYALAVSKQITSEVTKYNEAFNYHIIGSIYSNTADYQNARAWLEKAYAIRSKEKDEAELLTTITNLIYVWQGLGDIKMTHKYVLESEKLCEKISESHSNSYIIALVQLADVYSTLKRDAKAEEVYLLAIQKSEINTDLRMLSLTYQNYSSYLIGKENYQKAGVYVEKALGYLKKLNKPEEYRASRVNLAIVYAETGRKAEAFEIFKDIYELELKGYDVYEKSSAANNLGFFYLTENKYNKALTLFLESLKYAEEAKAYELMMQRYQMISQTYESLNDFKSALKYSRLFQKLNDSIFNVETVKQLNDLTEKYGNEKKEKKILELKKNNAEMKLQEEATKRESERKNIIFGTIIGLVILIAGFVYYSFLQKKKANLVLTEKNEQINRQHLLLEEKQKEILDSIHYARRIQRSLMSSTKYIHQNLKRLIKEN